ncbi:MAG TPA: glycosyltransferase family 2 protein, partial [Gammaproteobacteria bacterium]|nr:glycosyltransferase family 2 protein [Gammaproteobacteria bacterium]
MSISIVIPAYNEEAGIVETLNEIKRVCLDAEIDTYEIIVVNDGATDRTEEKLQGTGVKVITHPHNIGYGRSLKDGIKAAQYDAIVITDADCTYPFNMVPTLLKEYNKGFDMVVGARTGKYYQESLLKAPLRRVLRFIVEFSAERKIPDINSGLRIFSKSEVIPMLPKLCNTFSFTTSMTLGFMMTGKFVKYIDIPYYKRKGRTKVKLFKDSFRTLQYILQAINYYNPLKLFMLFAGFCIVLSFCFFVFGIFTSWKTLFSF